MMPLNPYVAGNPVGDSPAFIGRADVLREVLRVLRHLQGNAIVLFGQRRIGKTSILEHLAATLPEKGPYRPVYFDLQDKAEWPLERLLRDLACAIAHALGQPDPDLGDDTETTFRQKWLPTVLDDLPEGCSLALLFDEFDVLADPKGKQAGAAFFPYLRELLARDPGRLQFVFVIGRNVDDLDTIALSLFKGTPYQRVSLLSRADTADLVRLSEANDTLHWPDEAVERVWQLTNGHPFLTQQLCSHVWERAYDEDDEVGRTSEVRPTLPADVDAAVPDALDASRNTLEWLWDGLPPAERVVASALAEAGPGPITQDELEQLLHESGVRVVIRELQNAPRLLQDWDLIEPADGGYRFRVELLRQWIADLKPLNRVQEEMDRIEPVAESLYGAASGLYRGGQLDQAVPLLRQAIALNPNHVRANQLLADILLAQGQPDEARELLEQLYEYQPAAARSRLVQALLALAQAAEDDDERLALYEQVLNLNPRQPESTTGKQRIWKKRGDAALEGDDLETALEAYEKADLPDKVVEVEREMRRRALAPYLQELEVLEQKEQYREALGLARKLASEYPDVIDWTSRVSEIEQTSRRHALTIRLKELETLEEEGQYQDALELARELANTYPDVRDWEADLERLERETELTALYQRALGALQSGNREIAQDLLIKVINLEPGYKKATQYLHLAVTGEDVVEIRQQLENEIAARQKAEAPAKKKAGTLCTPSGLIIATPENLTQLLAHLELPERMWWEQAEMELCLVEASKFPMGSPEGQGDDDEHPQHAVHLDAYYIGRYLVTQSQYARFVQATGHRAPFVKQDWAKPYNWDQERQTPPKGKEDHPVVLVSWEDAADYCEWAGLRLPTEAEWEKAASWVGVTLRGRPHGQKRVYPWGDKWDAKYCNAREGGKGETTPVGAYSPRGDSPCGCADMAGNVWEWCSSLYKPYPYKPGDRRERLGTSGTRVLRGGSWGSVRLRARSAYRFRDIPGNRGNIGGFRCCMSSTS